MYTHTHTHTWTHTHTHTHTHHTWTQVQENAEMLALLPGVCKVADQNALSPSQRRYVCVCLCLTVWCQSISANCSDCV
jgi:hypothetical protein